MMKGDFNGDGFLSDRRCAVLVRASVLLQVFLTTRQNTIFSNCTSDGFSSFTGHLESSGTSSIISHPLSLKCNRGVNRICHAHIFSFGQDYHSDTGARYVVQNFCNASFGSCDGKACSVVLNCTPRQTDTHPIPTQAFRCNVGGDGVCMESDAITSNISELSSLLPCHGSCATTFVSHAIRL